ncbi:hypothetical protein [Paenibacillus segetis]|uniref:Uncharacterized protein n=1 Tax=Paenibacillus segetis TaxID=1325360 RepID=A0ABQ1YJW5_9BACL|nr:hypothetical protein GCM10008013_27920 [Paenibacillus segetis]
MAVSSLEHVRSEHVFTNKLNEIVLGTKIGGVNCLIINSNVKEITVVSNEVLDPMFEVNLDTDCMLALLDHQYNGWELQTRLVKPLTYEIDRNGQLVKLSSDCITYVAKKI